MIIGRNESKRNLKKVSFSLALFLFSKFCATFSPMVGIVDYNAGNIKSVERALGFLKAEYVLSKNPADLEKCDRLIFPGVGEAKYAMEQLKLTGFDSFLRDWAKASKPLMGICLGSQIIFEHSEEGDVDCLGLLKGNIRHFESVWKKIPVSEHGNDKISEHGHGKVLSLSGLPRQSLKVPHMGWNNLEYASGSSPLFAGVDAKSDFYFVHSYLIQPSDQSIVKAWADYGCKVPACVSQGSITAFQFHPEKSGRAGLKILENYIK